MVGFCDSSLFRVGEDGRVCHRRDGETWADKVLDGVPLDKTMYWENCGYYYIEEESGDSVVGERDVPSDVQEKTKGWDKERGEGKFKREKKIPQKKIKKYPTKPKPKNSWHKRISKVARQLDMENIGSHTEQVAEGEWNDFWDEKEIEEERAKERAKNSYWESWEQRVKENP